MNVTKEGGFMRTAVVMLFGVILLFSCDSGVLEKEDTDKGSGVSKDDSQYNDVEKPKGIEMVTLDKSELVIAVSEKGLESDTLVATVSPAGANYGSLNWSSSNEKVVTVDESGRVTALSAGKAVITVRTENGKQAECKVTVYSENPKLWFTLDESGDFYTVNRIKDEAVTAIAIPPIYKGKPVKRIGECAFYKCTSLESITIPDSVETIGYGAFYGCANLGSIELPNSVKTIEETTFRYCESLSSIKIPDSIETIGRSAFDGCTKLDNIELPNSIKEIGDYAFSECTSLKRITIPNSVKTMGGRIFYDCDPSPEVSYQGAEIPDGWDEDWNLFNEDENRIVANFLN